MPLHIANVGSSFAAGPGIPPQIEPRGAGRSGENYAHIVARKLEARLTDLSVSGATLLNLLSQPQTVRRGETFAPQISEIPEDVDVVLVLGGGNDIGYIGGLFIDSFYSYAVFRAISRIYSWFAGGPESTAVLSVEDLAERYGTVLDAIHAKAPNAKVVVVEYLSLLGSDLQPGVDVPFDASLLDGHKAKAAQVREATVKAVHNRDAWCTRLPIAEASIGHGLGSPEPWVNGWGLSNLYLGCGYHPNAEGMKAVADIVLRKLVELGTAGDSSKEV
ncbi:putative SGNH hydrolase-type esterase domain-containing protein [Seiridium cardinale]|uniref:SGNH hydrolase-type esterase domain-containing protein n=1 Tax=Seiridium cardinale TaxID=138064 RepID=A0ABR2XYQ3_9PEZI